VGGESVITTTCHTAPPILQSFDKNLLMDYFQRKEDQFQNKILPLAKKKIRIKDVGRAREFKKLINMYNELYERKKKERSDYKAAFEKKAKERPCLSTSKTMRFFRHIQS